MEQLLATAFNYSYRSRQSRFCLPHSHPQPPLSSLIIMHNPSCWKADASTAVRFISASLQFHKQAVKLRLSRKDNAPARSNCTQGDSGRAQVQLTFWSELSSCEFRLKTWMNLNEDWMPLLVYHLNVTDIPSSDNRSIKSKEVFVYLAYQ